MAALLRQGARRIGGSVLQRTPEERRLLVPRRMINTGERPSVQEVQKKKEELYEVLSKAESWRNRRLLQNLAVHVQPRPEDSQWSRLRASKWAANVAMVVSTISFSIGGGIALGAFGSKVGSYLPEKMGIGDINLGSKVRSNVK